MTVKRETLIKRENLIQIDDKLYQKCRVHLLPTDKAENCLLKNRHNLLRYERTYFTQDYLNSLNESSYHIYITSDEEIKDDEWFIHIIDNGSVGSPHYTIAKMLDTKHNTYEETFLAVDTDGMEFYSGFHELRKIIATTDTSLVLNPNFNGITPQLLLPQPSQDFINKYIEKYNKGEQIVDVLVEYEIIETEFEGHQLDGIILKVNKNNTITIRPVKDSWTLNFTELMRIFDLGFKYHKSFEYDIVEINPTEHLQKWIEENL